MVGKVSLQGVFFNPTVPEGHNPESWLLEYDQVKETVNRDLHELVETTKINFIDFMVLIPWTLTDPKKPPTDHSNLKDWARMQTLENLVEFLDECHGLGIRAEVDLASNLWLPFRLESQAHIANSPWWPVPDGTPWTESAVWYTQVIEYVESHLRNKDVIALWTMMGNYQWGGAEPVLWDNPSIPESAPLTEAYVKYCWPRFKAAGTCPKGSPIALPIFENTGWWKDRPWADRISAVAHLKKWLVDDLALPPDYWVLTTYVNSDPATDGVYYLDKIIKVLGPESVSRIISTDFKATGADLSTTLIDVKDLTLADRIGWNTRKSAEYGFAGWWMWCYRDTVKETTGIRKTTGEWKMDLVTALNQAGSLPDH